MMQIASFLMDSLKEDGTGRRGDPTLAELLAAPLELQQAHKYNVMGGAYQRLSDKYQKPPEGRVLGTGAYGKVYEVMRNSTGCIYACKEIDKAKMFEIKEEFTMRSEIEALRRVGGKDAPTCIVKLLEALEDDAKLYLILGELCRGSDIEQAALADWQGCGTFSEADAAAVLRAMAGAVKHCHDSGVLYLDVKPQNFLWEHKGGAGDLKLTDFGLAALWDPSMPPRTDPRGTPLYVSPEMCRQKPYTTAPDAWGLGICLAFLLTGRHPFNGDTPEELSSAICTQELDRASSPWRDLSDGAFDIVSRLLDKNAETRITVAEALEHPWVVNGGTAARASITCRPLNSIQRLLSLGPLSQVVLEVLAAEALTGREGLSLSRQFRLADADEDGEIGASDMAHNLQRRGYGCSGTPDNSAGQQPPAALLSAAERIVARLAAPGMRTLSLKEFAVAEMAFRAQAEAQGRNSRASAAFQLLDIDGDGCISLEDFKGAVSKASIVLSGTSLVATMEEKQLEDMFGDLMEIEGAASQHEEEGAALDGQVPEAAEANGFVRSAAQGCSRRGFTEFWDSHIVMPQYLLEQQKQLQQQQQKVNGEATATQGNKDNKAYRSFCWFPVMGITAEPPSSSPSKAQGGLVEVVVRESQGGKPKAAARQAFYEWQMYTL